MASKRKGYDTKEQEECEVAVAVSSRNCSLLPALILTRIELPVVVPGNLSNNIYSTVDHQCC